LGGLSPPKTSPRGHGTVPTSSPNPLRFKRKTFCNYNYLSLLWNEFIETRSTHVIVSALICGLFGLLIMYKMFALNNVLESATQMTDLFDLMCCGWRYFESFSSHHCSYERIFVVKMLHMTSLRFFSIAYALFDILLLTGQRTICGFLFAAHNQMEVILSTRSISTFDRPSLLFHPVLYLGKLINFCNR